MVGYIILAVLLLIILLVFFVPYGIDVSYEAEVFRAGIKLGPFRYWILPKKPKTEKQLARAAKKKAKKEAKKEAKKAKKAADAEKAQTDETIKVKEKKPLDIPFLIELAKMGVHAIRRFFHSFSIDYLHLKLIVASADPFKTAVEYGMLCDAVEVIPELSGKVIHVRRREIEIGSDFTVEKPLVEFRLILSLQLFKLVHMAIAFLVEFIKYKLKNKPVPKDAADKERTNEDGR